jgi:hypothetical protein
VALEANEEMMNGNDTGMIEPKVESGVRNPNEFSNEDLKTDADREMIQPEEIE